MSDDRRATDRTISERLSRDLPPGTSVLVHGKWYRVRGAHVADDGGLDLDVEPREPINVRLLDLGRALGVVLHEHEAVPERRTYTIARNSLQAERWAHEQPGTGWSEWRGSNGYEPWHYLGGIGARTQDRLRGIRPGSRVVLVDLLLGDLHPDLAYALRQLVSPAYGCVVESHEDVRRTNPATTVLWQAWPVFAQHDQPAES